MLTPQAEPRVYLSCQPVDMRKSIDGLSAIIKTQFKMDPFGNCLYVFCNRRCDKCKILHWSNNGFWLYYRKLSRGVFRWDFRPDRTVLEVSQRQLNWLLDGLSLEQPDAHKPVTQRYFI